ncbi:MAG: Ig-like domain-containing protein, partial [Candidatus Thermoplasmatota archaeon]|nr:Ig-like domain-containing protein [Candidatus Thermoplasmatota archaeon]
GHYITFLEVSNFQAKKRLVKGLRTYASDVGKDVVIGANSFALGTNRPAGYWPKGLQFSEMLDVFVFENEYTALEDTLIPEFPRNKWLAWEKLARAATGAPAVILLSAGAFASISPKEKSLCFEKYYDNYLSILCAEAYANRGSFVNWYYRPWEKSENWNGCAETYDFVLNHHELYDSGFLIDAPVAILYLYGEGMRNKTDTYLGLSQALAESNIPFEVIFDGDGYFINESLNLDKIESYDFLIIPSVIEITETQEQIIKEYVKNGGIALVFNPEEIGFDPVDGEVPYGNGSFVFMLEDIGYDYYHTYNNDLRQDIETVVKSYIGTSVSVGNANRKIIAFPYSQSSEERVVIHLVNYDHSKLFDSISQKNDISIRIKKPDFDIGRIYVISPDFEGKTVLQTAVDDEYVEFIVPYLEIYDVIVIEKQSDDRLPIKIGKPEGGFLYASNKKVTSIPSENSIIIGKIDINAAVENEGVELSKVEFYIDNILMKIDREFPYIWTWAESSFGIHNIKIISYDINGVCCRIDENAVWNFF